MQTFCEPGFEFKVLADVCAVGHYYPLTETPNIAIVPGEVHEWKAVLPSLRRPREVFRLGIKAEDKWGNPTDQASGSFRFQSNIAVNGLPEMIDYPLEKKSLIIDNLSVEKPGEARIQLLDESESVCCRSRTAVDP